MPAKKICARPGCGRASHAHGLCGTCRSRAETRGLPLDRPLSPAELLELNVPRRRGPAAKREEAQATPPNELRRRTEAEWLESYDGVLDESIKACEILGLDTDGDYDYLGKLRELVAEREAVRKALVHPDGDQGLPLGDVAEGVARQLQDEIQRLGVLAGKLEEAEAARTAAETHAREATARASRIAEELQAVRADLEGARRAHRLSEAQREVLQVELARATALKEHWQAEGSTLERLHDGAVRDRDEARAEARRLRAELAEAYSALRAAREELAARPVGLRASIAATVKRAAGSLR